jgi:hypothetical protein
MDIHISTPHCDGSTSDDLSVGVGFVGVTGSDMDLQDLEEPTYETAKDSGEPDWHCNQRFSGGGFSFWPLLSGQLRGFQPSLLTLFSSGLFLFCFA